MVFAVSSFPLDLARTVLEAYGLVLARRLSLCQLKVLFDGALWLRVVHEACGRSSCLPAMLAISKKFPL